MVKRAPSEIPDDPNPGLIGGVFHEGEWINVLKRYVPPPKQRPNGAGCFCYSIGRWHGNIATKVNGQRKMGYASGKLFCDMLRKFSKLPKPEGFEEACRRKPSTYQRDIAMEMARELGTHTNDEWLAVKERQAHRCRYCGENRPLTKDHLTPISRGGSDAIDNIAGACRQCNTQKNDRTLGEYLRYRRQRAAALRYA